MDQDKQDHEKLELLRNGLNVSRRVYLQEELNKEQDYDSSVPSVRQRVKSKIKKEVSKKFITNLIPSIKWLFPYKFKENMMGDMIAGLTIAIMHIPQGMAYALLGSVPPIYGIYMAFFPVIVYTILGTSRHVSMGTFAVVCLMSGNVVSNFLATRGEYNSIVLSGTVAFTVGIILIMLYFLRAGIIADLLSDTLVSSFTCASAFHIISSQLKDLLGLRGVTRIAGNFRFVKTLYVVGAAVPSANLNAVIISLIAMTILLINYNIFKPWLKKRTKVPFPIELVVVALGTTTSYFMDLETNYNVTTIAHVPTGFPKTEIPIFEIIPTIFYECLSIAMVSYTITMSMALMFANKQNYKIRANQELLALGVSDIVGSFFCCMPITASLSRSVIQYEVGGKTQAASLISCSILLFVLLWIGPIFEPLPKAVLASIIIVALQTLIMQVKEAKKFWHLSKWDFTVWICTFLSTVLINIDIGLVVGLIFSLTSIFVRGYRPYTCLLGHVPGTDLYLDITRYKSVHEIPHLCIFRFCGGLNFGTKAAFKSDLNKLIGFNISQAAKNVDTELVDVKMKCLIIDFSALTFIDPQGVSTLIAIQDDLAKLDIPMYIAACSSRVYEVFVRVQRYYKKENYFVLFPTIHDAHLFFEGNQDYSKSFINVK